MAGENILVVDDSVAVQELCRSVLETHGYRVSTASNGVAALSYPDLPDVDLLIIDTHLREINGIETTKNIRTDQELFRKPVLLLVPEEEASERESQDLLGANGFLKKPFEPGLLVNKVQVLLEEREILERGRQYLREAAEALMQRLADEHIQEAVEHKTQIIIERALQHVVTQVDQRARREVDARVTQLTAEKEQELVKLTVHEVARSMVEKLAERKVNEAMDAILRDETEKAVRRVAESVLPGLGRERVRESIEQLLPKEVQRRVQKEVEDLVPDASQKVVLVIESAAQKLVPKIAREIVGEITERCVQEVIAQQLPRHVQQMVAQELEAQVRMKIAPLVNDAAERINRRTGFRTMAMVVLLVLGLGFVVVDRFVLSRSGGGLHLPLSAKTPAAGAAASPAANPAAVKPAAASAPASAPTPTPQPSWRQSLMEKFSKAAPAK